MLIPCDQPGQVAVQEMRKLWKLHAKLLRENRVTQLINDVRVTKASGLKIGQLVFVEDIVRVLLNLHILLITGFQQ